MNIFKAMTDKELEAAMKLQEIITSVINASEDVSRTIDYRYEVNLTALGQTVHFVCDELNINKNITDYNCW
jgi:hypothetical protein